MGELERLGDIIANSALGKRLAAMERDGTLLRTASGIECAKARRLRAWCEAGRCRYTKPDPDKRGAGAEQCEGWWAKVRPDECYVNGDPILGWFRCPRHDRWWHEVEKPRRLREKAERERGKRGRDSVPNPDAWSTDR